MSGELLMWKKTANVLSKDWIELFADIVVLVRDPLGAQLQHKVGVRLAIDVHWVQVIGLHHIHPDQYTQGVIGWKSLEEAMSWVISHDGVVVQITRKRELVDLDCTLW